MGGDSGVAKAIRVSRLQAGQSSATQALVGQHGWGSASVSYITNTLRLRQAVEGQQGQLSRIAMRDVLWPVQPAVPSSVRQVRPRERASIKAKEGFFHSYKEQTSSLVPDCGCATLTHSSSKS